MCILGGFFRGKNVLNNDLYQPFSYNPVQCPFCNKGHRDNYNLKQHVCPVLNMKYGMFEKKEVEAGGSLGNNIGVPSSRDLALRKSLSIADRKSSLKSEIK